MTTISLDAEATHLLNDESIDYTSSPYKLKDCFKLHCIVVEEHETGKLVAFYDGDTYIFDGREYEETCGEYTYELKDYEPVEYEHRSLSDFPQYVRENKVKRVIGHNIINYDLLVFKLWYGMDYEVTPDKWDGRDVVIDDTLVISKTLNPDRFCGHSLDKLAQTAKRAQKIDFRKDIPVEDRFKHFAADMLYYNIYDVKANTAVYNYLEWEKGDWDWEDAISLEKAVAEIVTRQSHRGFWFDKELAENNIKELDRLMQERREKVEPLLPSRPATKAFMKEYTPPARQIKKNGEITSYLEKFLEKHNGELIEDEEGSDPFGGNKKVKLFGEVYSLPLQQQPLKTEMPATIDDTTHIKGWLVEMGWEPSEYKMKDITLKSGTKIRRNEEDMVKAVNRYVEETLKSPFKEARCKHLECTPRSLKRKLMRKVQGRTCKVLTNPSFTVGQEKELCPDLERIADKFPYVKDIVEYLTYKHRRNSILGGGLEWEEESEAEKGYLANIREDGRIATPADTCGTPTARFKHKVVANIPRVSSLYGKEMRAMFGISRGYLQIGYDFSSLEARIEGHYCYRYDDEGKTYCQSLVQEKPNDVHSLTAKSVSKIIGKDFERSSAKAVKYSCSYGAQEAKIAQTIGSDLETGKTVFDAFWESAKPLAKLKHALTKYWKTIGQNKFILGIDGRKIWTRAEHALINSLFQSGGMICAKYTMFRHDRLMKEQGLNVDFFKDDWKNCDYAQQLISMHDEAQIEETINSFEFKTFDSEEEAEQFRNSPDRFWSEVFKGKGGKFVLAWSPSAELIKQAVEETNEHFKLNVPLSADYMVGRNWSDTH